MVNELQFFFDPSATKPLPLDQPVTLFLEEGFKHVSIYLKNMTKDLPLEFLARDVIVKNDNQDVVVSDIPMDIPPGEIREIRLQAPFKKIIGRLSISARLEGV